MSDFNGKALDAIDTIHWAVRVTSFLSEAALSDRASGLAQEGEAFVLQEVRDKLTGAADTLEEVLKTSKD